jgi:hypothetical protein
MRKTASEVKSFLDDDLELAARGVDAVHVVRYCRWRRAALDRRVAALQLDESFPAATSHQEPTGSVGLPTLLGSTIGGLNSRECLPRAPDEMGPLPTNEHEL